MPAVKCEPGERFDRDHESSGAVGKSRVCPRDSRPVIRIETFVCLISSNRTRVVAVAIASSRYRTSKSPTLRTGAKLLSGIAVEMRLGAFASEDLNVFTR